MSKAKEIIATHQGGKEVKYPSIANAAKVFKCKEDHIRRALRGERNTACGMKWRYVEMFIGRSLGGGDVSPTIIASQHKGPSGTNDGTIVVVRRTATWRGYRYSNKLQKQ